MPELPEVETVRRGIAPHVCGRRVVAVVVRERRLRWPVPTDFEQQVHGQRILAVDRRAKYLLLHLEQGVLLLHLGMSGRLYVLATARPPGRHDHLDLVLEGGAVLRLHDPRRFGAALYWQGDLAQHPLLRGLGPEPLSEAFSGAYLFERARGRRSAVKNFLMDGRVVVGAGNIYAAEALHRAGIRPQRAAGRVSRKEYDALAQALREVLEEALSAGGTTLRDYRRSDGAPGLFQVRLKVYGREGESCHCGGRIRRLLLGQRSSFYCPRCQR